ncbi:Thioredoxin domain [Dillenia turbinata]|uniref:Thioredoxin-like protein HCF164, chloroplastic n=1 Tax=Dillenia turbinata TaxID=194707 RepID=A0AAN8ZK76_9MAGN
MARVINNPIGLHRFGVSNNLHLQHCQPSSHSLFASNTTNRRFTRLTSLSNPNPIDSPTSVQAEKGIAEATDSAEESTKQTAESDGIPEFPTKNINKKIALVSSLAAVGLFVFTRLDFGSVSLKDLSASALPYEEALTNGKPTVVEFYADWCEVCRELAPDIYKVEQQYRDRVNFVMLNVDNTKWEQELDEFGVEGIPHFAFLDREGNEEGYVVGRLPRQYFLENVDALVRGEASVPHARVVGRYSSAEARKAHQVVDPRSHG